VASVVLFVVAVVLGVLAFTRFSGQSSPDPSSPGYGDFHEMRLREARLSMALGLAASFALFGAFACHSWAGRPPSGDG
jgi:hypothetical protein